MEFRFDVGHILQDEVTLVDNNLIVKNWKSSTRNSHSLLLLLSLHRPTEALRRVWRCPDVVY
ncbi:hypothetical protein E2C01_061674 [Portunus trituberculatus]|uniref:Uncharacterized protein n=1 Tax=Portunus trituberculatus TaxID=210409 RepID=A0A5B7HDW5_PORTR|nr:hypothetical protein [Portunus trituberculatus]